MNDNANRNSDVKSKFLETGKAVGTGVLMAAGILLAVVLCGILLLYGVLLMGENYEPHLTQKQTRQLVEDHMEELDAYMKDGDFSSLPDIAVLTPGFQTVRVGEDYVQLSCGSEWEDKDLVSWGILYIQDLAEPVIWSGLVFDAEEPLISGRVQGTEHYLERLTGQYFFYRSRR